MVGSTWSSRDQPSTCISGNVALERFSLPSPTTSLVLSNCSRKTVLWALFAAFFAADTHLTYVGGRCQP